MFTGSGQFNLTTFISAVGVMLIIVGGVGKLVLDPRYEFERNTREELKELNIKMAPLLTLAAQIKSDDQNFDRIQRELGTKVEYNVYNTEVAAQNKQIEDNKTSTLRAAEELSHQVHVLEDKIVYRDENVQHWNDIAARITALETRLNALVQSIDTTKDRVIGVPLTHP